MFDLKAFLAAPDDAARAAMLPADPRELDAALQALPLPERHAAYAVAMRVIAAHLFGANHG